MNEHASSLAGPQLQGEHPVEALGNLGPLLAQRVVDFQAQRLQRLQRRIGSDAAATALPGDLQRLGNAGARLAPALGPEGRGYRPQRPFGAQLRVVGKSGRSIDQLALDGGELRLFGFERGVAA